MTAHNSACSALKMLQSKEQIILLKTLLYKRQCVYSLRDVDMMIIRERAILAHSISFPPKINAALCYIKSISLKLPGIYCNFIPGNTQMK